MSLSSLVLAPLLRYNFSGRCGTESLKLGNFDSAGMVPVFSASTQTTGSRLGQLKLKPVLNWAKCVNILRTVRRTLIRFLIELLVRRTWCGQFDELYFVLNWLMMVC